jgi:hypothetical protein
MHLSRGAQDHNLFGVLTGKMADAFVVCGEDQIIWQVARS